MLYPDFKMRYAVLGQVTSLDLVKLVALKLVALQRFLFRRK